MSLLARTLIVAAAGLFGALGVAGAAVAAHGGDNRLVAIAAAIALVHAPALVALASASADALRFGAIAALFIVLGTLLFSGDLASRTFLGGPLFANAAPAGGIALMAGWLLVAIGGLAAALRARRN